MMVLLLTLFVKLGITTLDIVAFFLAVRLLVERWPNRWLQIFDSAGAPLVDAFPRKDRGPVIEIFRTFVSGLRSIENRAMDGGGG